MLNLNEKRLKSDIIIKKGEELSQYRQKLQGKRERILRRNI